MYKHHRLDAILSLISLLQISLLILPFVVDVSTSQLILLILINLFLIGTNYQCVAHNFIHNPFFKSTFLNQAFSVLNSLCLGIPESVYRIHHLEHHRHNNNPAKDESSTYRYGKNGEEENIFLYSTLGVMRTDLVSLYKTALKQSPLVHVELLSLSLFIAGLSILNWKLFLGYVLTSYVFGQVFALWENYCEHHYADFSDRKRDSVSCYNSIYNIVWFNNGYHQEHHYSPTIHWTEIPSVKERLPTDRVIVRGCHLSNSFSRRKQGLSQK
jgi:fatty acid desaturase